MEKAPYPPCHAKPLNAVDWVFSHFEEDVLSSSTSRAVVMVREIKDSEMNVICSASHAKALAAQIAGYGGEVSVERGPYRKIKDGRTIFGAENEVNEDTGQRLRHAEEHKSGLQP